MAEAFYFGDSDSKRFAIYEPPKKFANEKAVLFCYPVGHEYLRAYRSFKLLSDKLTAKGAHCLRFDYLGTGDSFAHSEDCDLSNWIDDINLAVDELKAMSGLKKVTIVGLRLGAILAVKAAAERKDVDAVVCWDPVISGNAYLNKLTAQHSAMLKDLDRFTSPRSKTECETTELVGYFYSQSLMDSLQKLDSQEFSSIDSEKLSFVYSSESEEELINVVKNLKARKFEHQVGWSDVSKIETTYLPHDIIEHITNELMS